MLATDTPENNALAERKQKKNRQKNLKRVKVIKTDLFKNTKRKRVNSDTSDDEEEEFKCSGSSSGGDFFLSGSEEEEIIPPLARNPRSKDFVNVAPRKVKFITWQKFWKSWKERNATILFRI